MSTMNTRILVTGCAGFIGARVSQTLLEQGCQVVGLDNLNDAYDVRLKHHRLQWFEGRKGFTFHRGDIADRQATRAVFESSTGNGPFAAVINLAARAGVRQSIANPWVYFDTNLTGVLNLLEGCREFGVGKFVQASTSSLYGDRNPRPYREDADTNAPLSSYAASKKGAEALLHTYHHLFGIDTTILRFFTVYGPAGRPDMSIFRFIKWVAEGEPLVIFGDGGQERDFTYIDDVARGTAAACRPVGYEIINLGNDRPVKLMDVIHMIEGFLGREARLEFRPMHPADVMATWADISKAERLLDWRPAVSFEEGLRRSCEWYLENREWAKDVEVGD